MKKIYILALALGAFSFASQAQIDLTDNFDSYNLGPVGPQSPNWRTWSGSGEGTAEDAEVTDNEALSAPNGLYIDDSTTMDPIFLVPNAPTSGIYTIQWYAMIPTGKSGYFNMQGTLTPAGSDWVQALMGGNVYFNCQDDDTGNGGNTPGEGFVAGVIDCSAALAVFTYPQNEWFKVTCVYDLDGQTWELSINDIVQFTGYPLDFGGRPFDQLAGIDFYSASSNNEMYLDDLVAARGVLSTENFSAEVFSVYPNPVKDVLNISSKVAVDRVVVYDILGKVVLKETPGKISPSIDLSNLTSGTYMVKVTIDNNSKTVKIVK